MNKKSMKRIIIGLIVYILTVAVICVALQRKETGADAEVKLEQYTAHVLVTDGVAAPVKESFEVTIKEAGAYDFYLNCVADREGILTGCRVRDKKGAVVCACTGETMEMESDDLELKAGTYTVEFSYLTSEEAWRNFLEESDSKPEGEFLYDFQDNGRWDIALEYGFGRTESHTPAYFLGMACGVLAGLLFVAFLMWGIRKADGKFGSMNQKNSFDERQLLARGQAYKYAFFTMIIYVSAVGLIRELFDVTIFMSFAGMWIGVCLSITVFAVVCILKDAYMSLYENARGVIMMFTAVGLLNVLVGIRVFVDKEPLIEDGALATDLINLITGILFLVILVVFVARVIYNNRQLMEDEE